VVGEQDPRPGEQAPGCHRDARTPERDPPAGEERGGHHPDGEREEIESEAERGLLHHHLEVEGDHEEDGKGAEVGGEGDDVGAGERRFAEVADVEHRVLGPQLSGDEAHRREQGEAEEELDPPGAVAMGLSEDDGEGERTEGNRREDETRDVEPSPDRIGALGKHERGTQQSQRAEEQVRPEDRPPRPAVDKKTADQRTEGQTQARDGRPDAEGAGPGTPIG
jgi:hypothetical protein